MANEILPFETGDIVKVFVEACLILMFPLDTELYQGRHVGASHDLLHARRKFQIIEQRGR